MNFPARLVAIVGPTASGKSALGIRLAGRLGGEVVVCDSTQVYRYFDIGTAKVPPGEQRGIAHHLVDIVEPGEVFTAGEYRRRAIEVLEHLKQRRRVPILTVGTGLYLRALLEGLADAPGRSEELRDRLRKRASERGEGYLHRLLGRLDPAAAGRIGERDTQKVIRAIEICVLARKSATEVYRAGRPGLPGFEAVKVGLQPPRDELYRRIDRRVEAMVAGGWVDEVRRLLKRGIAASAKPFEFIGYPELARHLRGELSLEKAIPAIQQATRQYAKRQLTWFRKERDVEWFAGFGDDVEVQASVESYVTSLGITAVKQ
jgi:tRNA dimethylallyltransferase